MRSIKLFLVIIFILLAFLCAITFFLPSKVTVSKSVVINASRENVAQQINDFNNWKNWYPAFQSKNVVVSRQQNNAYVITLKDEQHRQLQMAIIKKNIGETGVLLSQQNKHDILYQFVYKQKNNSQTLLTWNVNTTLQWYPWKKIAGIFLDKISGPQYQLILDNLKTAIEKAVKRA